MSQEVLSMWTVYDHPKDYPNGFIARRWIVERRERFTASRFTSDTYTGDTLEEVRRQLSPELVRLERYPEDDPGIVEVWL